MGSRNWAALSETILVQEDTAYIGTLVWLVLLRLCYAQKSILTSTICGRRIVGGGAFDSFYFEHQLASG